MEDDVRIVRLDGTDRRNLTNYMDLSAEHPVWQP